MAKRPRLMEPAEVSYEGEYGDGDEYMKEDKSGVIRFEIGNVDSLNVVDYDQLTEVGGVPWRGVVYKRQAEGEESRLGVFLDSMRNKSALWSIEVDWKIILFNSDSRKNLVRKHARTTYNHACTYWGGRVLKWSDLIDEEKGFANDGKITVEIHLSIVRMIGIRTIPLIDFTCMNKDYHDVALIIEGEKVYVSRQILALHSLFFNSMFYGNFAEKNKKEIELKDVGREEFIDILNLIYPSHKKITYAKVESLLELADRFQIKKVIDQVEQFLIDSLNLDTAAKLKISEQFRLIKLQKHCVGESQDIEEATDYQMTIDFLDPNEPRHDVTLVVEGENIYASKQYLSLHSPVLSMMLKRKNSINLPVKRENFLEMLRVIYPSCGKVTDENVTFLIKLAARFQIKHLFDLAEAHLISSSVPNTASKLLISDKNRLIKLQDHIFSQFRSWKEVDEVKKSPEYKKFSDRTKVALLEMIIPILKQQV